MPNKDFSCQMDTAEFTPSNVDRVGLMPPIVLFKTWTWDCQTCGARGDGYDWKDDAERDGNDHAQKCN